MFDISPLALSVQVPEPSPPPRPMMSAAFHTQNPSRRMVVEQDSGASAAQIESKRGNRKRHGIIRQLAAVNPPQMLLRFDCFSIKRVGVAYIDR